MTKLDTDSLPLAVEAQRRISEARAAQASWTRTPLRRRLAVIRRARHRIALTVDDLSASVTAPWRTTRAETISAEILPLADACRFLERRSRKLLGERRLGRGGRPFWLSGSDVRLTREPWGVVLIVGPANYPLMLPGIQAVQALVAGNAVLLKPGRGGRGAANALRNLLVHAGLPGELLAVLDESPAAAKAAIRAGVDRVVLTGSAKTGRAISERLAPSLTPAAMELSGCDAVFVRSDADLQLAAKALRFGMTFNGGFTCIAPRRVFVDRAVAEPLERRLVDELSGVEPIRLQPESAHEVDRIVTDALRGGARLAVGAMPTGQRMSPAVLADVPHDAAILEADVAAPLIALVRVDGDEEALRLASRCRYALGTTIFGRSAAVEELARRAPAGVVVINDMIVPTADPRVPFGGRGESGFGVTRGAEGLLEMTRPKAVIRRTGKLRPHLDPVGPNEERLLAELVRAAHAPELRQRAGALFRMAKIVSRSRRTK